MDIRYCREPQQAVKPLAHFNPSRPVALDIETSGLKYYEDNVTVVTLGQDETVVVLTDDALRWWIRNPYPKHAAPWVVQNGAMFDFPFLIHAGMPFGNSDDIWDTRVAENILGYTDPPQQGASRASLDALMRRYLKQNHKREMPSLSWATPLTEEQLLYCAHDVRWLADIMHAQQERGRSLGIPLDVAHRWGLPQTIAMQARGVPLREGAQAKAAVALLGKLGTLQDEINALAGQPINPNSNPAVLRLLQDRGNPISSTAAQILLLLEDPLAHLISQYRSTHTLAQQVTHLSGDRAYSQHHPWGMVTGRISVSDPALQQMALDVRDVIDDSGLISLDYAQMELYIGAILSGDQAMLGALEGGDIHGDAARDVQLAVGDLGMEFPLLRKRTKGVIFTYMFGGGVPGARRAAARAGGVLSERDATAILAGIRRRFPVMTAWINAQRAAGQMSGTAESHVTGMRVSTRGNSGLAINFPIQHVGAAILKKAMEYTASIAPLVLTIHDQGLWEGEAHLVEPLRDALVTASYDVLGYPIPVDGGVGGWGKA